MTDRYLREEYIARINRVLDYIENHIGEELRLDQLARVANFSPYHFHRIFRSLVGEPLSRFIQRVRLERAANKLAEQPRLTVTEIAFACGFASSSSFARSFRDFFAMSPTQWRDGRGQPENRGEGMHPPPSPDDEDREKSKIGTQESKSRQDRPLFSRYTEEVKSQVSRRREMIDAKKLSVEVKELSPMHVAYIRHIGPYKGDEDLFESLFKRLFTWAGARNLLRFPETRVLAVYHDNPDVTDESRLRTSACITVPGETGGSGEVGTMTLPGGKYAVAHFTLSTGEYEEAWDALYGVWLPGSGYQPGDGPAFEMYLNDPDTHPEKKAIVDICMPVMPL
jgi:AraC family transcriptional regulator